MKNDSDSSYIMFSNSDATNSFVGLAKIEDNKMIFEQVRDRESSFTMEKVE